MELQKYLETGNIRVVTAYEHINLLQNYFCSLKNSNFLLSKKLERQSTFPEFYRLHAVVCFHVKEKFPVKNPLDDTG